MDLTAGTRATAIAAAVVMALGTAVVLYGVAQNDLARSLGGACLSMIALTLIALVSIRKWTTDTHAERGRLAEAMREADTERGRSVAVQAAMEVERARIRRDAAAELERMEARLRAERQAIRDQLEEERARMACESLGIAFRMIKAGLLEDRPAEEHGKVIGFPGAARAREEADCDAAACDREVSRP